MIMDQVTANQDKHFAINPIIIRHSNKLWSSNTVTSSLIRSIKNSSDYIIKILYKKFRIDPNYLIIWQRRRTNTTDLFSPWRKLFLQSGKRSRETVCVGRGSFLDLIIISRFWFSNYFSFFFFFFSFQFFFSFFFSQKPFTYIRPISCSKPSNNPAQIKTLENPIKPIYLPVNHLVIPV